MCQRIVVEAHFCKRMATTCHLKAISIDVKRETMQCVNVRVIQDKQNVNDTLEGMAIRGKGFSLLPCVRYEVNVTKSLQEKQPNLQNSFLICDKRVCKRKEDS